MGARWLELGYDVMWLNGMVMDYGQLGDINWGSWILSLKLGDMTNL
jgi:hypothetical protein